MLPTFVLLELVLATSVELELFDTEALRRGEATRGEATRGAVAFTEAL